MMGDKNVDDNIDDDGGDDNDDRDDDDCIMQFFCYRCSKRVSTISICPALVATNNAVFPF